MSDDRENPAHMRRFSRRVFGLFAAQGVIGCVLAGRLYQLQVLESENYTTQAEDNRIDFQPIAPPRGRLLDRKGGVLAENRQTFSLYFRVDNAAEFELTLSRLGRIVDISAEQRAQLYEKLASRRYGREIEIVENISWSAYASANINLPALPGVEPKSGLSRHYPLGENAAHVLGYVAAVGGKDLDQDQDIVLRLPGARIGRTGVEKQFEQRLRGRAGAKRVEVDAHGRALRELARDDATPGSDLILTLDTDLQAYAAKRCEGLSAGVVVLDVQQGDVLALVSTPSYNPNDLAEGISFENWRTLLSDPDKPLVNKASAGAYPPGSTFKLITALAAMQLPEFNPRAHIRCRGKIAFGDRSFHCWKKHGHGRMDLHSALRESCDVYFYEVAQKIGIEPLIAMARRFGLGLAPNLPLDAISAGLTPTRIWKRRIRGEPWTGGDTLNAAIGQGGVLATPLQLAIMTARIANGREAVEPRLVRSAQMPTFAPLDIDQGHLRQLRASLSAVVNNKRGTAYAARIDSDDKAMAGKTGTSQVRQILAEERRAGIRDNADLPRHLRDHALFVAYAPAERSQYAIAVVAEHGGSGAKTAAPIARDVLMRALYGPLPPLEAYPKEEREKVRRAREQAASRNG